MCRHNGENERGQAMKQTRAEILEDLRQTRLDIDCTVDEARAVLAIEKVQEIEENVQRTRDEIQVLRDDISAKAELLGEALLAVITSRHSGERQADQELERRLKELGIKKGGQGNR